MENVKQILDELDDGYKYFAIKKDGCWYKIEFDSFMVKDIERAQNICSELNQMLKNESEGKEAGTGENNALLPDVSGLFVLYRTNGLIEVYWNGKEWQQGKENCPTYSYWKANEYAKVLNCNFTDAK